MNIGLWLERAAVRAPDAPAIFLGHNLVADYATFHARGRQLAGWLVAQGVGAGDRVAIFMKNTPDYLIALYGTWYAGAAVVPINAKLHGREAAWIIEDSGAVITFASPGLSEALHHADAQGVVVEHTDVTFAEVLSHTPIDDIIPRAPGDLAWLFYTSGTTGRPKGVMITHRMISVMTLSYLGPVEIHRVRIIVAPMWIMASKLVSVLQARIAIRLNSLSF